MANNMDWMLQQQNQLMQQNTLLQMQTDQYHMRNDMQRQQGILYEQMIMEDEERKRRNKRSTVR